MTTSPPLSPSLVAETKFRVSACIAQSCIRQEKRKRAGPESEPTTSVSARRDVKPGKRQRIDEILPGQSASAAGSVNSLDLAQLAVKSAVELRQLFDGGLVCHAGRLRR